MTVSEFNHPRPFALAAVNAAAAGLIGIATGPVGGLAAAVALGGPWVVVAVARRFS